MQNLLDNLFILKGDRPCMTCICRDIKGKIIYVNEFLRRRYPNLKKSNECNYLIDYGFTFENGIYVLKYRSMATYPDGQIQNWQGKRSFTYNEIKHFNYFKESE